MIYCPCGSPGFRSQHVQVANGNVFGGVISCLVCGKEQYWDGDNYKFVSKNDFLNLCEEYLRKCKYIPTGPGVPSTKI